MTQPRFKIVKGSQSAHCCFDFTVVDTTKPRIIGGKHYNGEYVALCECFDLADAELVVQALNLTFPKPVEASDP